METEHKESLYIYFFFLNHYGYRRKKESVDKWKSMNEIKHLIETYV